MRLADTTVTNFTSNKVPGVFVWPTANVTLKNVTFRNMALEGDPNSVIPVQATSVGVYHGGGVLLEVGPLIRLPPEFLRTWRDQHS